MSVNLQQQAMEVPPAGDDIVKRIGNMIRMLRDSMRDLGLHKEIEKAAKAIPDARDRLSYIGNMTEQAAERALNAIDRAQPMQAEMASGAQGLAQRWQEWYAAPIELEHARELVRDTCDYLDRVPALTESTNKELLDIMMAQDFQDLTGQVIKKMMEVIRSLEFQLLQVLLDSVPEQEGREELQKRADELREAEALRGSAALEGPQVNGSSPEIISSQDQVDDLLADLGF